MVLIIDKCANQKEVTLVLRLDSSQSKIFFDEKNHSVLKIFQTKRLLN